MTAFNLSGILTSVLANSHIDLTAFKAKVNLYALQGVAYARLQAIKIANENLGKLAGPDQEKIAVDKGMELYQIFEGGVPVLAATTLDDLVVRQIMQAAVHEAFALVQNALDQWSQQATTPPALPAQPAPTVPDTTYPAPVTNAPELPTGDLIAITGAQ